MSIYTNRNRKCGCWQRNGWNPTGGTKNNDNEASETYSKF